jgi:hypothetical protein
MIIMIMENVLENSKNGVRMKNITRMKKKIYKHKDLFF